LKKNATNSGRISWANAPPYRSPYSVDWICSSDRRGRPVLTCFWNGTPEWIRTTDLLLRRLKSFLVFSKTCMRFVDAIWTETGIAHRPAALFMGMTFSFAGLRLAALTIFSDSRSSTSVTC